MFDKLIDLIIDLFNRSLPFVVITEYQCGVLLRLGRYRRELPPGFNWIIPLADHVEDVVTVWTTLTLPVQSVATKDRKVVIAKGMVKYRVSDPKTYTLDTYDAKDALSDTVCGIIFDAIHTKAWAECSEADLISEINTHAKKEAKKWGITVGKVTLTDFGDVRSLRLFNEGLNTG